MSRLATLFLLALVGGLIDRPFLAAQEAAAVPVNRYTSPSWETVPWARDPGQEIKPADPLESKELARAMFEALRDEPRTVALGRVKAAEDQLDARLREFHAGRGALDVMLEAQALAQQALLAVLETPEARVRAHRDMWMTAVACEQISNGRFEMGRVSIADHYTFQVHRRDAEIAWLRAAAAQGTPAVPGGMPPLFRNEAGSYVGTEAVMWSEALLAASMANVEHLARERVNVAKTIVWARTQEFLGGRGTLDVLLSAQSALAEAQLALANAPSEELAALRAHWFAARTAERINEDRHSAGRISNADLLQTRCDRIRSQIRWLRALARLENPTPFAGPAVISSHFQDYWDSARDLAHAFFDAAQADPGQLQHQLLDAARGQYASRESEFVLGRGTLDLLLQSSAVLLEAELALARNRTEREAAQRRHWKRAAGLYGVAHERQEASRISIADFASAQERALDAQFHWLRARQELERP